MCSPVRVLLLPLSNPVPAFLVHRVVDEQDGGDVFLGRIPPLLLQGLEVLLLRGVEPLVRSLQVAVIVIF